MGNISKAFQGELDKAYSNVLMSVDDTKVGDLINQRREYKENSEKKGIIKSTQKKSDVKNLVGNKKLNLPIGKVSSIGRSNQAETKEAMGSGAAGGGIVQPITFTKKELEEKWSQKYKDSINCNNPRGFSQKAHCQGKKKKSENKEATGSSAAGQSIGKVAFVDSEFVRNSFKETPKLEKKEFKEATGSASAGSYVTPAAWAKSTSKKDWRGKNKTLFPGGKFVQVKKKCKKFPYCNQGDINALNLTNESLVDKIITELSEEYNLSKTTIKNMIIKEYLNTNQ